MSAKIYNFYIISEALEAKQTFLQVTLSLESTKMTSLTTLQTSLFQSVQKITLT